MVHVTVESSDCKIAEYTAKGADGKKGIRLEVVHDCSQDVFLMLQYSPNTYSHEIAWRGTLEAVMDKFTAEVGEFDKDFHEEQAGEAVTKRREWDQHIYYALEMRRDTLSEMLLDDGLEDRPLTEKYLDQVKTLLEEYETKVEFV